MQIKFAFFSGKLGKDEKNISYYFTESTLLGVVENDSTQINNFWHFAERRHKNVCIFLTLTVMKLTDVKAKRYFRIFRHSEKVKKVEAAMSTSKNQNRKYIQGLFWDSDFV